MSVFIVTPPPGKPVGWDLADAAQRLLGPGVVVTTWPGGSKAVAWADWTPLRGRKVIVWPDNDEAGQMAARAIADILK